MMCQIITKVQIRRMNETGFSQTENGYARKNKPFMHSKDNDYKIKLAQARNSASSFWIGEVFCINAEEVSQFNIVSNITIVTKEVNASRGSEAAFASST